MSDRFDLLPAGALHDLLTRAHQVHLHRLRGLMQRLTGWAALGGVEDQADALNSCIRESGEILECLAQLGPTTLTGFTMDQARSGDWPRRLLGCALRWGTPSEWNHHCPLEGDHALAAALYAETLLGPSTTVRSSFALHSDHGELRLKASPCREIDPQLRAALGEWLEEVEAGEHEVSNTRVLRFRLEAWTKHEIDLEPSLPQREN